MVGGTRRPILCATALVCVPLAYMLSTVVSGVQDAEGCSGAGPITVPQWMGFGPQVLINGEIATANNGFHYIDGEFAAQSADEALAALAIEVRDSNSLLVSGSATMLRTQDTYPTTRAWVGWRADVAPIAPGTYSAKVTAPGKNQELSVTYTLSVSPDAPVAPALPTLEAMYFGTYGMGVGQKVSCKDTYDSCFKFDYEFGHDEAFFPLVALDVTMGPLPHTVLWEHRISEAPSAASLMKSPKSTIVSSAPQSYPLVDVIFPGTLPSYCVTVSTHDLATTNSTSGVTCFDAQPPTQGTSEYMLKNCDLPPTEALREKWCAESYKATPEQCPDAGLDGGGGTGGSAGIGGTGGAPAIPDASAGNAASQSEDDGGCQLVPSRGSPPWLLLALASLALLGRRRPSRHLREAGEHP